MALYKDEVVNQDTLELLTKISYSPFPVGYARIDSWHINPNDPSFMAMLLLYYNKDTRENSPASCAVFEMGANLTPELLNSLKNSDDRDNIYKVIEFIIHHQAYTSALKKITDREMQLAFIEEKNAILDELDNDLGIDLYSLFKLQETSI